MHLAVHLLIKTSKLVQIVKEQCQKLMLPTKTFSVATLVNGGARRDRTADLLNANQALSQLSYGPLTGLFSVWPRWLARSGGHVLDVRSLPRSQSALPVEKNPASSVFVDTCGTEPEPSSRILQVVRSSRRRIACYARCEDRARCEILVGLGRFELPTSPLSGVRSNQLSYRPEGFATTDNL